MNRVIAASVLLSLGVITDANADCSNNQVTDLQTLLSTKHVCAVRGSDVWRERHEVSGDLIDIKKGLNDEVDPEKKVGTWSVSENGAEVTYTYNESSPAVSFTYKVYETAANPGTYDFCDTADAANIVTNASIQQAQCGPLDPP